MGESPHDKIYLVLTSNLSPSDKVRAVDEELRRLKMVRATIAEECRLAALPCGDEPGRIDPMARVNDSRSEEIKKQATPALASLAAEWGGDRGELETVHPDGTRVTHKLGREPNRIAFGLSLSEVGTLAKELKDHLVDLALKVGLISAIFNPGLKPRDDTDAAAVAPPDGPE